MSVRRVYSVLVDGQSVFSGSYQSSLAVYESVCRCNDLLNSDDDHVVVLAFKPDIKSNFDGGLFV